MTKKFYTGDMIGFNDEIKKHIDKLVLVDFYATWCGPCQVIAPKLEQFADDNGDKVVLVKVDMDECEVEEVIGAGWEKIKDAMEKLM